MTGTDLERYDPAGLTLDLAPRAWALAQRVANTDFVPKALRGNPAAVLACILTGNEVGVGPMQALAKIHVIEGRPAMSAELMRALVLRAGHDLGVEESSSTRCILVGRRRNSDTPSRMAWTIEDAERAKLTGRDNWRRYPTAMLLARATGALCRAIFPDVLAGVSYTAEELDDGLAGVDQFDEVARPAATPPRRARASKRATRPSGDTVPPPSSPPAEVAPLPGEAEPDEAEVDDDIVDAEIVDAFPDDAAGDAFPDRHDESGPAEADPGPTLTGPQHVAMRFEALGIGRTDRLRTIAAVVGRDIGSANELDAREVAAVLDHLAGLEADAEAHEADEAPPPAGPRKLTRIPGPPSKWSIEDWHRYLRERNVKVTDLLAEARHLADQLGRRAPRTMREIPGGGLETALVGYVEDRGRVRE